MFSTSHTLPKQENGRTKQLDLRIAALQIQLADFQNQLEELRSEPAAAARPPRRPKRVRDLLWFEAWA